MKESESEKGIQHLNTNWILALLLIKFTAFDPRFHVLAKPMMAPIWPISIFNFHWFWSSKSRVLAVSFNFLFGWTPGSYFTALKRAPWLIVLWPVVRRSANHMILEFLFLSREDIHSILAPNWRFWDPLWSSILFSHKKNGSRGWKMQCRLAATLILN